MKHTYKNNAGFTLVELVVAMAMAVIVTAAATSVLLMGLRVNRQTADTASQQITVRSLLSIVEKAAADGNIQDVITDYESWQLVDSEVKADETNPSYRVIFGFDSETQTIYTGRVVSEGQITNEGTIVLEGVYASNAIIEDKLLSVSVETKEGIFASSIYCRTTNLVDDSASNELPGTSGDDPRGKFIEILKSQYRSRGEIKYTDANPKEVDDYTYYSEWYIQARYDDNIDDKGWNSKTPWCACYISWALSQVSDKITNLPADRVRDIKVLDEESKQEVVKKEYYWYANVDDFMAYFQNNGWQSSSANGGSYRPVAGDIVFFDWNKGIDPEHVGVVLSVKEEAGRTTIYTIEGNSAGRVTIRSYSINDPRIIGYGVLWQN